MTYRYPALDERVDAWRAANYACENWPIGHGPGAITLKDGTVQQSNFGDFCSRWRANRGGRWRHLSDDGCD
jgi:hypothetical protein